MTPPRWLRVRHDYPRCADRAGRPVLEASRVVPLSALFPRGRSVTGGAAHEDWAWLDRTAAHARWHSPEAQRRRGVLT